MVALLCRPANWALLALLICGSGVAQQPPAAEPAAAEAISLTAAEIDGKVKELEARTDLDEATVGSIKDLYQSAKQSLATAESQRAKAAGMNQQLAGAADGLSAARSELDRAAQSDSPQASQQSPDQLQTELAEKQAALDAAREELTRLAAEPSRRQARLAELPKLIQLAKQQVEQTKAQLDQVSDDESTPLSAAKRTQLQASLQAAEAELAALESERALYNGTAELLPLEQQLAERKVRRLETEIERWQQAIAQRREHEIDRLRRETAAQVAAAPPPLKPAAELNAQLVEQYRDVSRRLSKVSRKVDKSEAKLKELKADYDLAQSRVDALGLNDTLGLMLRRTKSSLLATRSAYRVDPAASDEVKELQVGLFEYQDLAAAAVDNDLTIDNLLAEADVPVSEYAALTEDAKQILKERRDILTKLIESQSKLLNQALDLDQTQRQIVKLIDEFIDYINQHILWIRSGPLLWQEDLSSLRRAVSWMAAPKNWNSLWAATAIAVREKFALFLFLAGSFVLLGCFRFRLRKTLETAGGRARNSHCREFAPTVEAAISTFLLATFWPFLILAAGWLLTNAVDDEFVQAASGGLIWVALAMFPFELMRQACRDSGLATDHFEWPRSACRFVRANLRSLNPLLGTLLFLIVLLQRQPNEAYRNSLGRLVMVTLLLVVGAYVFRLFRPSSGMYRDGAEWRSGAIWYRFRRARFYIASGVIVALLIFTLAGYYYSTYQIGARLLETAALVIAFVLCYSLATRWLLVRRRRIHIERLAIRREEIKQQPEVEQALGQEVKVELKPETELDIADISRQSRQLFLIALGSIGLWIAWRIWRDVTPAVGILDQIELWKVNDSGISQWVTLGHVVLAIVMLVITVIAVKNLPGILELLLLKRLPMDAGGRYAVVTIVRYVVTIVGLAIACTIIKVPWSQFGWLVAAISVGLGFGLQEIVANFVSGLILLLERPVRVGDIVTIEGTTGVISRIQMRATTVTNWDQQELVVPNKNLITNPIVNWTLTNVVTRLTIPVGIAYASDAERAHQVIHEVVAGHPHVLEEPKPGVTFENFGDSSLNFVIRCCVSGLDKRLPTTHELHVAIHQRLAAEGIEIPFPQRDVHLIQQP